MYVKEEEEDENSVNSKIGIIKMEPELCLEEVLQLPQPETIFLICQVCSEQVPCNDEDLTKHAFKHQTDVPSESPSNPPLSESEPVNIQQQEEEVKDTTVSFSAIKNVKDSINYFTSPTTILATTTTTDYFHQSPNSRSHSVDSNDSGVVLSIVSENEPVVKHKLISRTLYDPSVKIPFLGESTTVTLMQQLQPETSPSILLTSSTNVQNIQCHSDKELLQFHNLCQQQQSQQQSSFNVRHGIPTNYSTHSNYSSRNNCEYNSSSWYPTTQSHPPVRPPPPAHHNSVQYNQNLRNDPLNNLQQFYNNNTSNWNLSPDKQFVQQPLTPIPHKSVIYPPPPPLTPSPMQTTSTQYYYPPPSYNSRNSINQVGMNLVTTNPQQYQQQQQFQQQNQQQNFTSQTSTNWTSTQPQGKSSSSSSSSSSPLTFHQTWTEKTNVGSTNERGNLSFSYTSISGDKTKFTCKLCRSVFTCSESLLSHQATYHRLGEFPKMGCPHCGKMYASIRGITAHMLRCHSTTTETTTPPLNNNRDYNSSTPSSHRDTTTTKSTQSDPPDPGSVHQQSQPRNFCTQCSKYFHSQIEWDIHDSYCNLHIVLNRTLGHSSSI